MGKRVWASILTIVLALALTATSALALTVDQGWTFAEDFEGTNDVTYAASEMNSVYYFRKTDAANGYSGGSFVINRTSATGDLARSTSYNHTEGAETGYSLRVRNIADGDTKTYVYIANTYFYGNPSTAASGSGVFFEGYDGTTSGTYFYNGAHYYEQEFYLLFPSGSPDGFGSAATTFQMNMKAAPDTEGGSDKDLYATLMQVQNKKLYGSNSTYIKDLAADTWYRVKFAVDFDANRAYAYVDGDLIYTYVPTTQLKSTRRIMVTAPHNSVFYIDDITSNPYNAATFEDVAYTVTYTGDYTGTALVAPNTNTVLPVAGEGNYVFTVNGDPFDGKNITSDVTVDVALEGVEPQVTTYNVESVEALDDILVRTGDTAADITLPDTVEVTYGNGAYTADADVTWGAVTLPTVAGNYTTVTGTLTLPNIGADKELTNTDNLQATVKLVRANDSLAVKVNGTDGAYTMAKNSSVDVTAVYGNAGEGVEYAFVESATQGAATEPTTGWSANNVYAFNSGDEAGTTYVTAYVKDAGHVYSAETQITVSDQEYTANIYANATAAHPTYSEYRVNANGGLVLTSDITDVSGNPVTEEREYAICVPSGDVLLKNTTGVFTAAQLKTLDMNEQYWVRVLSVVNGEDIYAGRLIYLANYGATYASYIIDGRANGSGIAVSKNKDLGFSVTFEDGNIDEGEVYASYMLLPYDSDITDATAAVATGDYTKTNNLVYSAAISGLNAQESGAYNLVWNVKKTSAQDYVDRTIAKCVYLYGRVALVNNIYLNDSLNGALGNAASLTLKAHWLDEYFEENAPALTYKYEIYKSGSDLTEANLVFTQTVEGNETVTIADLAALGLEFENTVRLSVYRDGALDFTFDKIFYPTIG